MTLFSLQALSWGTITGAVASTLLLAAREPAGVEFKPLSPAVAHTSNSTPARRLVSGLVQPPEETVTPGAR
jgi:hypothetical protein